MKSQIIQIGNSQGVRLPKALLEESGITGEVDLVLCDEGIMIRGMQKVRGGWSDALRAMVEHEDEDLANIAAGTDFDRRRWQW